MRCSRCEATDETRRLLSCPVCKRPVCTECVYKVKGKDFCTRGCGSYFFFGEGEDDASEIPEDE